LGVLFEYVGGERRDIEQDTQIMGIRQWRKQCKERAEWKRITEKAITHSGL
jgi:hypothetical protein